MLEKVGERCAVVDHVFVLSAALLLIQVLNRGRFISAAEANLSRAVEHLDIYLSFKINLNRQENLEKVKKSKF